MNHLLLEEEEEVVEGVEDEADLTKEMIVVVLDLLLLRR
jgi:hypothetical protein